MIERALWNRRGALAALGFGAGALALAGCRGGGGEKVLRVGSQKGGTKAPVLASGVLEGAPYRVEWSEFPAAQHLLEALGSDAVDIGLIGDAPFLFAYQTGKPLKAVAVRVSHPRPAGILSILVPGASPVRKPADLKGRKIVTGRGSIGHFLALKVFENAGIKPGEAELIFMTPSDAAAALRSGAVDAWSTWGPYVPTGQAAGDRILADGSDLFDACSFDVVHENVLRDKPDLLVDFLAREARAMEWRRSHVADYAKVLAKETGLPLPIAQATAERSLVVDGPVTPELVARQQAILDTFVRVGALEAKRPVADGYVLTSQLPKT